MKIIKYLLLALLILISLTSIFNTPGANLLNSFYNLSLQTDKRELTSWLKIFSQYPPGVYLTLNYFLSIFPADPKITLFDHQTVWLAIKFLLYSFYLLTYLALLYLKKSIKNIKISYIDLGIAYFASIPILLTSSGIIFFDILSAPFLILSINYLYQKKTYLSIIFYLLSLVFNWSLFIIFPVFLIIFIKEKLSFFERIAVLGSFLVLPLVILFTLLASKFNSLYFLSNNIFLNPAGFPKLLSLPVEYVFKNGKMDNLGWSVSILSSIIITLGLGYLLKNTIFKEKFFKKTLKILPNKIYNILSFLVAPFVFSLSLLWTNSLYYSLLGLFLITYSFFVVRLKSLLPIQIPQAILTLYLIASLFIQDLGIGSLGITVLMCLVIYIFSPSRFNFYLLLILNLLGFINIFSSFGTTGIISVRGEFFQFFQSVFSSFFILFIIWYLVLVLKNKFFNNLDKNLSFLKWLIIILMILVNISWIPADGSSDHVSWTQYSLASIEQPNPFAAQTLVDQRYPPLSTAILSVFANGWKIIIGPSPDYAISTKLSVFVFYFLTIYLLIKFSKTSWEKVKLSIQDKLLIILTTFSIIIQTQGFADLNIHLIPSLFAAIFFLSKRKYFLSGLFMGITISIKWQPMILLPLFGASIFNFKEIKESLKNSLSFILGLLPIPILAWVLVLINPGGNAAFERATTYLIHGAPMLSGQALNLNWIVTYFSHIFNPSQFGSLQELDYFNRQIPTDYAPVIFQGYFFLFAWVLIVLIFWLRGKKNIGNFLAASLLIFFAHHQLNKSAYEKHIFYVVILMLFLYLIRPTSLNRWLLIIFDIMTVMNLIFFYGFTGTESLSRTFFHFDITIIFSLLYLIIFLWVFWAYIKGKLFG